MDEIDINTKYDLFISHYQYSRGQLALIIKLLIEMKSILTIYI